VADRERAREFLERSLAIRNGGARRPRTHGHSAALATIDAEQGRVDDAIASDREALALAVAPSAIERIRFNSRSTPPAAGHPVEAKAQLDK